MAYFRARGDPSRDRRGRSADRRDPHRDRGPLGPPSSERNARVYYDELDPALCIDYDAAGNVRSVEIPYSGTPGREVTLAGIQLTHRPIDDVLRDLEAAGYSGRRSDIGYDFPEGFSVWSMSSLQLSDIDPSGAAGDERLVVEGVVVARPAALGFVSIRRRRSLRDWESI